MSDSEINTTGIFIVGLIFAFTLTPILSPTKVSVFDLVSNPYLPYISLLLCVTSIVLIAVFIKYKVITVPKGANHA